MARAFPVPVRQRMRPSGMREAGTALRARHSFSGPEQAHRVQIREVALETTLQLRLQFVGGMHLQIGIADDEAAGWREGDGLVHRLEALRKQRLAAVQPSPALAIVTVRDVE